MPVTKSRIRNNEISDYCKSIEKNACELREIISQISEGSTLLSDKEGEIFTMLDEIKEDIEPISSEYDDIESERDKLKAQVEEFEEEEESTHTHEISGTTISYDCSNFTDTQIMEAMESLLSDTSKITKPKLLAILENLAT